MLGLNSAGFSPIRIKSFIELGFLCATPRPFGSAQKLEDKTYIIFGTHTSWVTHISSHRKTSKS